MAPRAMGGERERCYNFVIYNDNQVFEFLRKSGKVTFMIKLMLTVFFFSIFRVRLRQ